MLLQEALHIAIGTVLRHDINVLSIVNVIDQLQAEGLQFGAEK